MPQNIAIVGAGIVGLAHAWSAASRGHKVTIFERSSVARGASIRNFGMIWPIGQPEASRPIALESRQRWLTLARDAGIWVNPCGSLHLAHRPDEWEVLVEFYEGQRGSEIGKSLTLLDRDATLQRSPAARSDGLIGAWLANWNYASIPAPPSEPCLDG